MVHNLKLSGDLFDAIRKGRTVIPIQNKKTADILPDDVIEFLNLEDLQHKIRVRVLSVDRYTEENAALTIEWLRWSNADMQKASRFLALILRHHPEIIGISLDEHGWADVDALIEGVKRTHDLTRTLLEDIVRADGKGRYRFNDDRTKIRANQGHSIPVDVELKAALPPAVLYHGTGEKYLDSILKEGLLPQSRLYVHLSADADTARSVGARHGRPVVLQVDAAQMYRDGCIFYLSANNVWLCENVPPQYLQILY